MVTLSGDSTICLRFNIAVFRLENALLYLLAKENPDADREFSYKNVKNSRCVIC